jgi:hypothetical protein
LAGLLAPDVVYALPTFGWQRQTETNLKRSVRFGGGLRVYLRRPWFSSGAGELLGVALWASPFRTVKWAGAHRARLTSRGPYTPACTAPFRGEARSAKRGRHQLLSPASRSSRTSFVRRQYDHGPRYWWPHHELYRPDIRLHHRAPPDDGGERGLDLAVARGAGGCACSPMLMERSAFVGVLGELLRRADWTIG